MHPPAQPRRRRAAAAEKYPDGLGTWGREFYRAHVGAIPSAARRAFTRLCRFYADRVEAEHLAAAIVRRPGLFSPLTRRAVTFFFIGCLERENALSARLGLDLGDVHPIEKL